MGLFAAPNTTAIMNSVPAEHRGSASGMRATFQNTANTLSITFIFTMVVAGLASRLPNALYGGLTQAGLPSAVAQAVANLPPSAALFAAFLGYNPMATLIPANVLHQLPAATQANLVGRSFFPGLIAGPFEAGLRVAFSISVALLLLAAVASFMRGQRVIYGQEHRSAAGSSMPSAVDARGVPGDGLRSGERE